MACVVFVLSVGKKVVDSTPAAGCGLIVPLIQLGMCAAAVPCRKISFLGTVQVRINPKRGGRAHDAGLTCTGVLL